MVLTGREILDLVIMTAAIGYIFKDTFRRPNIDPLHFYSERGFNWDDFWYACMVVGPSIILHEMAHKFIALGFGGSATFHAAYTWLGIGVLLKVMNFGFIFFVPGYVSISGLSSYFEHFLAAFGGPLVHLILWLGAAQYLKGNLSSQKQHFWVLVMQINKFLFILNMLPIPGFDGFAVYSSLFRMAF